jgi:CDP-glucose 4,6-dehydratase
MESVGMIKMINKSFWKHRNVFITGCTGLLGSWMCKYLVEMGANVTGLVRDWVPGSKLFSDGSMEKINVVRGCLEDYQILERALGEYEIETVFHLGAQTIVGIANRNPLSTFESNVRGTWNVLEACRRSPLVKRTVIASSDKAYGKQEVLPYIESSPLSGRHPYDVSKSCADLIAQSYHLSFGLNACVTRCGNFFGGGDLNFNRLIPDTIRSTLEGKPVVIRSDGNYIRDYFYIEDAVDAYLTLAQHMDEAPIKGQAFNFSNEIQLTVLDMVRKILGIMGSDLEPVILNQAANEIRCQYLSSEKSRSLLGWKPVFTLEEALGKTINWYRKYLGYDG